MVIIGSGIRRELAVHRSTSRISTGGKPGNQPFQGVLLIGGDARLSHVRGIPALGLSNANGQSSSQNLPDLTFLDEGTGTGLDLGPVQAIHLTMSHPGRCASNYSAEQTLPPPFLGQSQVIAGQADAPVQRQWRLGWWSGPRSSQSWPLVGDFPGVSFNDLANSGPSLVCPGPGSGPDDSTSPLAPEASSPAPWWITPVLSPALPPVWTGTAQNPCSLSPSSPTPPR